MTPYSWGTPHGGRFFGKPLRAVSRFSHQDAQTPPFNPVWEKGVGGMRGKGARECRTLLISPKNSTLASWGTPQSAACRPLRTDVRLFQMNQDSGRQKGRGTMRPVLSQLDTITDSTPLPALLPGTPPVRRYSSRDPRLAPGSALQTTVLHPTQR